jgi:hypothetical protein
VPGVFGRGFPLSTCTEYLQDADLHRASPLHIDHVSQSGRTMTLAKSAPNKRPNHAVGRKLSIKLLLLFLNPAARLVSHNKHGTPPLWAMAVSKQREETHRKGALSCSRTGEPPF